MEIIKKIFLKTLRKIYYLQKDLVDRYYDYSRHKCEIDKFKDSRRVSIFSKIQLTEEQKKQIDAFYIKNYGKKIPYIWHRHYTAFTGKFDVTYFPELLYIPEFEYYQCTRYSSHTKTMGDKNIIHYLASAVNVNIPKTIFSCIDGLFSSYELFGVGNLLTKIKFKELFNNIGEVFIKPTLNSCSGRGCMVLNVQNGIDVYTNKAAEDIIDQYGDNFIIQERLVCHDSVAKLYPHSVNTFRIITYRWKNKIYYCPIILRIGQGGKNVDNAHAGGMFIAVNDDGTLHKTAFTEFNKQYIEHPDTHIKFEGYKIPNVNKIIESALRMHGNFPQPGIYNWDFTLNKQGEAILIEANTRGGSIWLAQMAHGKGIFGDNTAEILQWLNFINKIPISKRNLYKPGYFE